MFIPIFLKFAMVHPCRRLHQATAKRYCDFEKERKFVSEFAWEGGLFVWWGFVGLVFCFMGLGFFCTNTCYGATIL